MSAKLSVLPQVLQKHETAILSDWIAEQQKADGKKSAQISESERSAQSKAFLKCFVQSVQSGNFDNLLASEWDATRSCLEELSTARQKMGFDTAETATFVFSLKRPVFNLLKTEIKDTNALLEESWAAGTLLDKLGLITSTYFQKSREEVIKRQQTEMLELSTPVVQLWQNVLAVPLIGTLDSNRTQIIMENLLQKIVETGSTIAIIDITGVPTVDTLVAQHLLKTISAARLMGADCIISGIRPQIAQTIVHLGVDLGEVVTKGKLADAFALALKRSGMTMVKLEPR